MIQSLIRISAAMFFAILLAVIGVSIFNSAEKVQVDTVAINRFYGQELPTNPTYDPEIKIYIDGGLCSAVVIDANYALTASHCLVDSFGTMLKGSVMVILKNGSSIGTEAKAVAIDRNRDVGLIKGNFNNFYYKEVDFDGTMVSNIRNLSVTSCGFPAGGEFFCSRQALDGNEYFLLRSVHGLLIKGMSGGPVYENDTGKVIGVNSAVGKSFCLFGPVLGVRETFGI